MDRMVAMAMRAGVAVGAHPSHQDLRGFGRRVIQVEPEEVEADVVYQVGALLAFVRSHGARLTHVKPHGALYNQAAQDATLARAIARGVARISRELRFVGLAGSETMRRAAEDFCAAEPTPLLICCCDCFCCWLPRSSSCRSVSIRTGATRASRHCSASPPG